MFEPTDIVISSSPAYWITGVLFMLSSMEKGFQMVQEVGCTPLEYLDSIEKHKGTTLFTANNFLAAAGRLHEGDPRRDLSSVRHMYCGGTAMGADTEERARRAFGCPLSQAYGMTELNTGLGLVELLPPRPASVGTMPPYLGCRIVDPESGRALARGEAGELRFKGPTVTPGYLHNDEATAELFDADGWLRSGDIGFCDADGHFFITGRIKDIIKFRGNHVSPVDIENVLDTHPGVLECCVVGVPNVDDQEHPRAYVVLKDGAQATAEELCKLVEGKLGFYKQLHGGVVFLDAMPKLANGKISRAAIRNQYVLGGAKP